MAIFNSYVSLPEGNKPKITGRQTQEYPQGLVIRW